jgi:hypothetical protein
MDELDAAHLRPTGIAARMADRVDAACHGARGLRCKHLCTRWWMTRRAQDHCNERGWGFWRACGVL